MSAHIRPVDLAKAYRLLNHGPTVLVSARHQAVDNVMAAAWCCALDFEPPKLTVVLDKATRTRALIEGSGPVAPASAGQRQERRPRRLAQRPQQQPRRRRL
ncbi:flavin reductase, partial [Ectopseudomonas hydrolytica]|uniref:flavin reductase n=1 Tax=Ectopseudomonas hydrolytica TaxID=2493633 RepID=UPI003C2E175B